MAGTRPGRVSRSMPSLDPVRALPRGEDRRLGGRRSASGRAGDRGLLLIEPCRVPCRQRRRAPPRARSPERPPARPWTARRLLQRRPRPGRRRDRRGHVVAGQPGRLQPVRAPLTRADMRVHGDVAARRVLQLVPVQQPQVPVLGVVVGLAARSSSGSSIGQNTARSVLARRAVTTSLGWNSHAVSLLAAVLAARSPGPARPRGLYRRCARPDLHRQVHVRPVSGYVLVAVFAGSRAVRAAPP